jgi:hypothetical protein
MDGPLSNSSRNGRAYGGGGLPTNPSPALPPTLRSGPRPPAPSPGPSQNPYPTTSTTSNGMNQNTNAGGMNLGGPPQMANPMSARAEQFHDERTRIIASLFARQDPDGKGKPDCPSHFQPHAYRSSTF